MKYFKCTNESQDVVYVSWSKDLLTEEQAREFEQYKQDEENNKDYRELEVLRKMPMAERLKRWTTAKELGHDEIRENFKAGRIRVLPSNYKPEYKFKLPKGESILTEGQYLLFKKLFGKRPIKQKIQYGQTVPDVHYEGFLTFEELNANLLKEEKKEEVKKETLNGLACDVCGKVCASEFGLRTHKKSHDK